MAEKVLAYNRAIVPQTTSWSCGPGAAEIVLNGLGKKVGEQQLIRDIGTTTRGTDYVGLIETRALNRYDPDGRWRSIYLPKDPPTKAQQDAFWSHIVKSIGENNRGLVLNWVIPPWNRPKAVPPSKIDFRYPPAWVWHYVALMGFNDDNPRARRCWIADSGFYPGGCWVSFEQTCGLITPKGYAYSAANLAPPRPAPAPAPAPSPATPDRDAEWSAVWASHMEWLAYAYADPQGVDFVVRNARAGDPRAIRALALLEQENPEALASFIEKGNAE